MTEKTFGFGRSRRIRKRREFLALYQHGYRVHTRQFVVYFGRKVEGPSRLGITASRKIGNPVVRNRVKRQIREIFRLNKASIVPAADVVVNLKRASVDSSYQELQTAFLKALSEWGNRSLS